MAVAGGSPPEVGIGVRERQVGLVEGLDRPDVLPVPVVQVRLACRTAATISIQAAAGGVSGCMPSQAPTPAVVANPPRARLTWIFMPRSLAPGMMSEPKSCLVGKCCVSSSLMADALST